MPMGDAVPTWAAFFNSPRYAQFINAVREASHARTEPLELDEEAGMLRLMSSGEQYDLVNLAQSANQAADADWAELIANYLDAVTGAAASVPTDLESLRPLIRVRLFPTAAIAQVRTVKSYLAEGLVACLAVDLPDRVEILPSDVARNLGVSSDDLFAMGLQNVLSTVQVERREAAIGQGARLISLSGDDFFVASLALAIDRSVGEAPVHGHLVGVPNRHEVILLPLESRASLTGIGSLASVTRRGFVDGPGSVSPYVYWVRENRWTAVEFEVSEEGVGIQGPAPFIEEVVQPLLG